MEVGACEIWGRVKCGGGGVLNVGMGACEMWMYVISGGEGV